MLALFRLARIAFSILGTAGMVYEVVEYVKSHKLVKKEGNDNNEQTGK